ncbi:MAG: L-seryl-tRNA(Sec) selenium transferase, partial [Acidobacteriota bacterium]|nr:L-seryl-tRNA(Sec) selenium transferase [Acidobacteriota bacterium]
MPSVDSDRRRQLPAVDRVLVDPLLGPLLTLYGTGALATQVRAELAELREELAAGRVGASELAQRLALLPERLQRRLEERFGAPLCRVLNGTGIFLHTNLGRAPLPAEVAGRLGELSTAACDLELDLATGRRGDRAGRLEGLLLALTGAEAARVTNNSAAALLLALAALAAGREVIVSRGELVEIGGSFRIPEILAAAGARIVEVGTTNRTRLADYERAIGPESALLLKVHASNFRLSGFVAAVEAPALADLAHRRGLALVVDEGAGLLRPPTANPSPANPASPESAAALAGHPSMAELLAAGCDLVIGSGDKLLGGPQAGLLLGRCEVVERCARHPIYRAVRPGRLVTAALDGVLRLHLAGRELPIDRLWAAPESLEQRLVPLAARLGAEILPAPAFVGGGAAPEIAIAGRALAFSGPCATP